jgi:hypothetical protein
MAYSSFCRPRPGLAGRHGFSNHLSAASRLHSLTIMARYVWASTSAKPSLGSGCESCEGLSTVRNLSLRTPDPLDNNLQRADQQASKRCDPHNLGEKLSPTLKLAARKRLAQGVPHHRQPAWPRGLTPQAARERPPRSLHESTAIGLLGSGVK